MIHWPVANRANQDSDPAPAARGRWYVFAVVALAAFLLAVVVWRQPPSHFTARAVLLVRGEAPRAGAEIASDEAFSTVVHEMQLAGNHAVPGPKSHHPAENAAEKRAAQWLRERLAVETDSKKPGETRLTVWHVGHSPELAVGVVDRLSRNYLGSLARAANQPAVRPESERTENAVRQSQADVPAAQREYDAFLATHRDVFPALDGYQTSPAALAPPPTAPPPAAAPPQPAPVVNVVQEQLNPEWVELNDRLQVLRAARNQLLTKCTPRHPQVMHLDAQIEDVDRELLHVRRTIVREPAVVHEPPPATPQAAPVEPPAPPIPSPELIDRHRKLLAVLDAARRRHEDAVAQERSLRQQQPSQPSVQAEILEPARIVATSGGGPSRGAVLLGGAFALLLGGVIATRARAWCRPATLAAADELEQLGVPVVAVLATRDGPAIALPVASNPNWIKWLLLACELMLAAIALCLLLAALGDSQLGRLLVSDPLSAFSQAIERLNQ